MNTEHRLIDEAIETLSAWDAQTHCTPRELVRVVEEDVDLMGRVLGLINQAYGAHAAPLGSVKEALVLIGFNALKKRLVVLVTTCMKTWLQSLLK